MRVTLRGTRGSLSSPGPDTVRYGGNTSCVELIGDAGKAKRILGWEAKVLPPELAKIMVDADIARLEGAPEGKF
mgnify:CR=1 FL=1